MEGFLPNPWWEIWFAVALPVVAYGIYRISKISKKLPEAKPLLALMGAFIFIISALKLPSLTVPGSSSHPDGFWLSCRYIRTRRGFSSFDDCPVVSGFAFGGRYILT